jgi:hypothetical protein
MGNAPMFRCCLRPQQKPLLERIGSGARLWGARAVASSSVSSSSQAAVSPAELSEAQQQAARTAAGSSTEDALLALLDYNLAHPNQTSLGGPGGHPVLRLLRSRLQAGSDGGPGRWPDKCKLGLVVEGGGMRGIVTGAMLMALQDSGLIGVFDAVYGERLRARACPSS